MHALQVRPIRKWLSTPLLFISAVCLKTVYKYCFDKKVVYVGTGKAEAAPTIH